MRVPAAVLSPLAVVIIASASSSSTSCARPGQAGIDGAAPSAASLADSEGDVVVPSAGDGVPAARPRPGPCQDASASYFIEIDGETHVFFKDFPNRSPCDDGNPCTVDDACAGDEPDEIPGDAECIGTPVDGDQCDDGNACTAPGACTRGECVNGPVLPDGSDCSGESAVCDRCIDGECVVEEKDDGDDCTNDFCSEGEAVHSPKPPGSSCGSDGVCDASGTCVPACSAPPLLQPVPGADLGITPGCGPTTTGVPLWITNHGGTVASTLEVTCRIRKQGEPDNATPTGTALLDILLAPLQPGQSTLLEATYPAPELQGKVNFEGDCDDTCNGMLCTCDNTPFICVWGALQAKIMCTLDTSDTNGANHDFTQTGVTLPIDGNCDPACAGCD